MSKKTLYFALVLVLVLSTQLFAGEVPQFKQSDFPETVTFAGIKHHKAFKQGDEKGQFIIEYIPEGENLQNWTSMFAVRMEAVQADPKQVAMNIGASLHKKGMACNVFLPEKKPEAGLEFTTSTPDKSIVEYNTWRYFKVRGGILSYQYAKRFYAGKNTQDEMSAYFREKRQKDLDEFEALSMPLSQ